MIKRDTTPPEHIYIPRESPNLKETLEKEFSQADVYFTKDEVFTYSDSLERVLRPGQVFAVYKFAGWQALNRPKMTLKPISEKDLA